MLNIPSHSTTSDDDDYDDDDDDDDDDDVDGGYEHQCDDEDAGGDGMVISMIFMLSESGSLRHHGRIKAIHYKLQKTMGA